MDPIQPINPATPSPINPINPTQPKSAEQVNSAQSTPVYGGAVSQEFQIDVTKISRNEEYFISTLDYLLAKARLAYNAFDYTTANERFSQFFDYFKQYSLYYPNLSQWGQFFGGFYEARITSYRLGQEKEAEQYLNQLINLALEQEQFVQTPQGRTQVQALPIPVQTEIERLQQQGLLPTLTTMTQAVKPETLEQLSALAAQNNLNNLAVNLLGLALAQRGLNVYQAQLAAVTLLGQNIRQPIQPMPFEYLYLPFGFRHQGLPYAYQALPEQLQAYPKRTEVYSPELMPDVLTTITPMYKDPNEDNERRRRRRMVNEYRKAKNKNPRRKPPRITF